MSERFHLELVALQTARWRDVPAARRLARGLRYLLRACGFRCAGVQRVTPESKEAPP